MGLSPGMPITRVTRGRVGALRRGETGLRAPRPHRACGATQRDSATVATATVTAAGNSKTLAASSVGGASARDRFGDFALHQGMHGEHVRELQGYLRSVGLFESDDTGYFGEVTAAAVSAWQVGHGLLGSGVWDAASMAVYEEERATGSHAAEGAGAGTGRQKEPRGRLRMRGSLDVALTDQGMDAKFRREKIDRVETEGPSNERESPPVLHTVAEVSAPAARPVEGNYGFPFASSGLAEHGPAYVAAVVLATAGAIWVGHAIGLLELAGFSRDDDMRRSRRLGSRAAPRPVSRRYAPAGEYGDRPYGDANRHAHEVQLPRKVREPPLPPVSPRGTVQRPKGVSSTVVDDDVGVHEEEAATIPREPSMAYRTGDEDENEESERGGPAVESIPRQEQDWREPPVAQVMAVDSYPPRPRAAPSRRTPTLPPGMESSQRARGDGRPGFAATRQEVLRQLSQEMGGSVSASRGHGLRPAPGARSPRPRPDLHEGRNAAGLPTFDADSYAHWEHWNARTRAINQ